MIEKLLYQKQTLILLLFCFLSGLCFHYFFYGKTVGISVPIYTIILYFIYFRQYPELIRNQRKLGWFFFIIILLLSITFALFSNEMFRFFNILLLPLLFLYHTFLLKKGESGEWAKPIMIAKLGVTISYSIKILSRLFPFLGKLIVKDDKRHKYEHLKSILIGIIISAPILVFVTFLLMSSDENFFSMIIKVPVWFTKLSMGSILVQSFIILFISLSLFSYFLSLQLNANFEMNEVQAKNNGYFNSVIIGTVLTLINFVYILYMISQFSYFFDVNPANISNSYSYATYARRGFAELTIVSMINFTILLFIVYKTNQQSAFSKTIIRFLLSLLVVFTAAILFSAFYRLSLYEEAYGFTYSRVLAHSFMILLLILLICSFLRIWLKQLPLLKIFVLLSLTFYVGLNYLNIDVFIIEQNIARYEQSGKIDLEYIGVLSDDVIPYLIQLQESGNMTIPSLIYKQETLLIRQDDWQEWNWSSHKAYQLLKESR
ncbi:DUF4153 domain-containing protein [Bacillus sp. AK128]